MKNLTCTFLVFAGILSIADLPSMFGFKLSPLDKIILPMRISFAYVYFYILSKVVEQFLFKHKEIKTE